MPEVQISFPSRNISDSWISETAAIQAQKLQPLQETTVELFGPAASVTALTKWLAMVSGATGAVLSFESAIAVVASGADRTITVDLQKSTGAGAFSTICSATIGYTNGSAVRTFSAATLNATSLVEGDILQVVVTVAGAAGAQATGLTVKLRLWQTYA